MVYLVILAAAALAGLIVATYTDLKKREVPDWLSYGMIATGLGLNLLFSFIYKDYWLFVNSLAGFLLFLAIALGMFYSAQWGGGDSKVLMGMGALIGLDVRFRSFPFLGSFIFNLLVVGAVYGMMWSLVLALKNWRRFHKEFRKIQRISLVIRLRVYLICFVILIGVLALFSRGTALCPFFLGLLLSVLLIFYLSIFVKAIEKSCMIKSVTPERLTEGDWIVREVKYKGKYICGPKDLGIEKKQIRELVKLYRQNKIRKVLIKEGMPFVPSFLIAYITSFIFGNLLFLLI